MEDVASFGEMAHQVGGHATTKTSLKAHGGKILKPFQSKRRGMRERDFYERVFVSERDAPCMEALRRLVPDYYGTVEVAEDQEAAVATATDPPANGLHPGKYLMLEDLTWGRAWPCIMDVKVGTRSYEADATAEKIAYERQKFPLQERVGFRIQGLKVFDASQRQYVQWDKHFGRQVASEGELAPAFRHFFPVQDADKTISLLQAFLRRLEEFRVWFDEQQETEFIASSLLFLYNGEGSADDSSADIRLIDFAHASRPDPPRRDDGVRTGIATLTRCFQELLREVEVETVGQEK